MKLPKSIVFILGGIMVLVVIVTIITLIGAFFTIPDTVSNFQETAPSAVSLKPEFSLRNPSPVLNASSQKATIHYPVNAG